MNFVVGASGRLGTEICRILRARGERVRGLVRNSTIPEKVQALRELGVELVEGNLKDPASLRAGCAEARTVLSTVTVITSQQPDDSFDAVDDAGQRALIDAARASGVTHFIFVSVSGNIQVASPLMDAKRRVEEYLRASGMAWTILRPTLFMDIWLGPLLGFDHQNRKARILGDGTQRLSYIAMPDVARFAAACVNNPAAYNRVIELGGPQPLTPLQAVATFEKIAGAKYELEYLPIDVLRERYEAATHPTQKTFAGLMLGVATDDVIPMAETAREFGIKPTPLEDVVPRLLASAAAPH